MIDARRAKLEDAPRGVNLLWVALILLVVAGCGRPLRPIPSDPPMLMEWPTLLGDVSRAGLATEPVPELVEQVWRAGAGRGLMAPPLVEGPVVLVTSANRMVGALDRETGQHYWERRLDGAIVGAPILREDRLYVVTSERDGRVHALSVRRGGTIWSRNVGGAAHAPLLVGGAIYVANEGGHVFALDTRNGEELWRTRLPRPAAATPTPYREELVVAARDTVFLLERLTGEIRRRAPLPAGPSAAPALAGNTLYLPLRSGEISAFELPELEEVWRGSFGDHPILAAPVAAPDGTLYVLNRAAQVWRLQPGRRSPELLVRLSGAAHGSLTLVQDGLLVGRLDGALFFLRLDGSVVWREDFDDSIRAPVVVKDGAIYVPLLTGRIVKLR